MKHNYIFRKLLPMLLLIGLSSTSQALDFEYRNIDGEIIIDGYTGSEAEVTIPSSIDGFPVTRISTRAFSRENALTSITVPSSISHIYFWAFQYCSNLRSIYFEGSRPTVSQDDIFTGTDLTVYYLPWNPGWGSSTFCWKPTAVWNCFSYTSNDGEITITGYTGPQDGHITIPSSLDGLPVTTIGLNAFSNINTLTSITIPSSVTSILEAAFYSCNNLTTIYFEGDVPMLNGVSIFARTYNATIYVHEDASGWTTSFGGLPVQLTNPDYSFKSSGYGIEILKYTGAGGEVVIPETINGLSVTRIPNALFNENKALTSVSFPSGVTKIVSSMCKGCSNLSSVYFPDSIVSIGGDAFDSCISLKKVKLGNNIESFGSDAFASCSSLTSVTIPRSVTDFGSFAFAGCPNLTSVYFMGNYPSSGTTMFWGSDKVNCYYLPWTSGWGTSFEGKPAAPWLPQILVDDSGFGETNNLFGFAISAPPAGADLSVVVEACSNIDNPDWTPVGTNSLNLGSSYFCDSESTNNPARFYRINTL